MELRGRTHKFTEEELQMASKPTKKCLNFLLTKEHENKTKMGHHFLFVRLVEVK